MQWTYAYKKSLPDSCFAFVDGATRKLPVFDRKGRASLPHIRNALARLSQTDLPSESARARIKQKLKTLLARASAAAPAPVTNKGWQPVTNTASKASTTTAGKASKQAARRNPTKLWVKESEERQAARKAFYKEVVKTYRIMDELTALFEACYPWCGNARLSIHPLEHSPNSPQTFRDVAWAVPEEFSVHLVQRACFFDEGRLWGLLAHELAHLADPAASEAQADLLASQVIQMPILYDEDGIQNVLRGRAGRPSHLHA